MSVQYTTLRIELRIARHLEILLRVPPCVKTLHTLHLVSRRGTSMYTHFEYGVLRTPYKHSVPMALPTTSKLAWPR